MQTQYTGNLFTDDRGLLRFVNTFDFQKIKRFYQVSNHKQNFIRAWHGHLKEEKYVYVAKGIFLIGITKLERIPSDQTQTDTQYTGTPQKYILSDASPSILHIPAGYANGFMNLTLDNEIIFFSTASIEETKNDDIRFEWDYFGGKGFWEIKHR